MTEKKVNINGWEILGKRSFAGIAGSAEWVVVEAANDPGFYALGHMYEMTDFYGFPVAQSGNLEEIRETVQLWEYSGLNPEGFLEWFDCVCEDAASVSR